MLGISYFLYNYKFYTYIFSEMANAFASRARVPRFCFHVLHSKLYFFRIPKFAFRHYHVQIVQPYQTIVFLFFKDTVSFANKINIFNRKLFLI